MSWYTAVYIFTAVVPRIVTKIVIDIGLLLCRCLVGSLMVLSSSFQWKQAVHHCKMSLHKLLHCVKLLLSQVSTKHVTTRCPYTLQYKFTFYILNLLTYCKLLHYITYHWVGCLLCFGCSRVLNLLDLILFITITTTVITIFIFVHCIVFCGLSLLFGRKEWHLACNKICSKKLQQQPANQGKHEKWPLFFVILWSVVQLPTFTFLLHDDLLITALWYEWRCS